VQLRPDDWIRAAHLGIAHHRTARYAEAVDTLERVLSRWQESAFRRHYHFPFLDLASAYLALNRPGDAERVLRTMGISPSEIDARLADLKAALARR
jgi:hypothetical protein